MIRLNLLPNVQRESLGTQQAHRSIVRVARVAVVAAVGVTLLLATWVYGVQAVQRNLLDKSISDRYQKLRAIKDIDTYATIQNRLAFLEQLHADKNLTSRLFDYLPSLSGGVKLNRVTLADDNESLVFEGEAIDYRRLVIFRDSLRGTIITHKSVGKKPQQQSLFSSVILNKSTVRTLPGSLPSVSFKVTGRYHDLAFQRAAMSPSLSVSSRETTPSVLAAPLVDDGTNQRSLEVRP